MSPQQTDDSFISETLVYRQDLEEGLFDRVISV